MNRIVLIGNGFDLAHGMKTSYKSFIQDFWESKGKEITGNYGAYECDFIKINKRVVGLGLNNFQDIIDLEQNSNFNLTFKNSLIKELSKESHLESFWVDIENEYYQRLKKITKKKKDISKSELNSLHNEFKQIKELLKEYLLKIEKLFEESVEPIKLAHLKNKIRQIIESPFNLRDLDNNSLMVLAERICDMINDQNNEINNLGINKEAIRDIIDGKTTPDKVFNTFNDEFIDRYIKFKPENILLLNFNYTDTHLLYTNKSEYGANSFQSMQSIKIHGCIHEPNKNPIIFGFGDEIDKDYQDIENLDDNDYLENIKSIKYLETDNYRKLLEFAESDQFQIFIFGHSCGNSDRTLLNTLFEHENCVSIKPYYHKRQDESDNYSDIVRNISRNFKSKAKMRERVVNKTYTSPIPR